MVIIQHLLNSMEVLFSVKCIIPSLIVDILFNWIFPILWVMSVHYWIGNPLLHIYPLAHFAFFLCIIHPLFTVSIPNWHSTSLARIHIISRLLSLPPLQQMRYTLLLGGGGVFILLHLPIHIIWHHNFPPLIFVIIVGPISTTPLIIIHGIHISPPQKSLPHINIKFKGIEKRLGEVMSPVHYDVGAGYLNLSINTR